MAAISTPKFTFESKGLDKDTFAVVKFRGTEGLSTIYRFDITLLSEDAAVDLDAVLQNPAVFTIKREDGDVPFNGVLCSFEQLQQAGTVTFYRATLVPRLWWATLTHHNQIFLNENVKDFMGGVLQDCGLQQGLHFDFKLQSDFPTWEYICQYDESHFNFVSRWMERDGMYYYFEQSDQGEKMVITDTHLSHLPMSEGTTLTYSPPSNLDHADREEVVKNFILKQQPLPRTVLLKDYNYRKPSLEMRAEALVSDKGMGDIYIYGEHFQTPEDGQKLADIRAQEFVCRQKLFHAVSSVPYIRTGYVFDLKGHYRTDFNQRYLTIEATHEGSQEAYLVSGLGLRLNRDEDKLYYRNSFTCIPADTQFRAERTASKPKFTGSMNAKIDAAGSGQYAELDSEGRYKVVLPLDVSGRSGGKATAWLRMAQPYGGSDHGMHFPLHKGTEVLLTCIDGDPDRPIIQAAVPNPETPSQVSDANQTQCRLTTGGQNELYTEDQDGNQRMLMKTPTQNTFFRIGSHNDPPPSPASAAAMAADDSDDSDDSDDDGISLYTEGTISVSGYDLVETTYGNKAEMTIGATEELFVGNKYETNVGFSEDISFAAALEINLLEKTKLLMTRMGLIAEDSEVKGTEDKLAGEIATLAAEVTKLKGQHTELAGDVTKLEGEHTALKGDVTKIDGAVTKIEGEVTKIDGEVTKIDGAVTKIEGEVTKIEGEVTGIQGAVTKIEGEVTKIDGEVTKIEGDITRIDGETTSIAGSIAQIVGMKTVL